MNPDYQKRRDEAAAKITSSPFFKEYFLLGHDHCYEFIAKEMEAKLEKAKEALRKIGHDDDVNTSFNDPFAETEYYIDIARQALKEIEG